MNMKVNIPLDQMKNHPSNVRKNYSGISELAESIKAFGILQNLTVVPEPGHEESLDSFYVVCGNRRLMAAREAGLVSAPCVITDMSEKDQVATMMAENMARSSLTPFEEGQGIQMMLDLGETEEQVAQKTGLSRSTIRRRLELAKLDQEIVDRKMAEEQKDGCFQISLTDLYRLEKVKDEKDRNKILSQAKGPENLKYLIDQHLKQLEMKEAAKRIKAALKKAGIKKGTKEQTEERFYAKYVNLQYYHLSQTGKRIDIPKHSDSAFYVEDQWSICIYDKKAKQKEKPKTARELEQEKEMRERHAFEKVEKNMAVKRRDFIRDVCAGKYPLIGNEKALWIAMISGGTWASAVAIDAYLSQDGKERTTKDAVEMARETPMETQMLAALGKEYESVHLLTWNRRQDKAKAEKLKLFYKILFKYGFSITDPEEKAILYGTHEAYIRDEKDEEMDPEADETEIPSDPPVDEESEKTLPSVEIEEGSVESGEAGDQMVDDDAEGGRPAPEGRVSVEEYLPLIAKVRESMGKLRDEEKAANWKEALFHADLVRIAMNRLAQGVVLDPQKDIGLPAEREALEKSVTDLTDNLQRYINLGAWTAGKITAYKLTVTLKGLAEEDEDVSNA